MAKNHTNTMAHTTPTSVQAPQSTTGSRGLPSRDALRDLATTYLDQQTIHWPALVGTDAIPHRSDKVIDGFVDQFETAYRTETVAAFAGRRYMGDQKRVGATYVRYSDTNSNPRSLDQQLIKVLATARQQHVFIPWTYVFADSAISATTTARPGYRMLETAVSDSNLGVKCIVVDELDRLNRNQEDGLRFGKLAESKRVQLLASTGYDSTNSNAKVVHTITSLHNEMHIDQLRLKVNRGMSDTFQQGKNVGLPPLGYKVVPDLDSQGNIQINRKGKVMKKMVIDDEAADVVRLIFKMYGSDKMSCMSIARKFNDEAMLGKATWCQSAIAKHLTNEKYIGKFSWRTTQSVINPRTGKHSSTPRPPEEHLVKELPEMRIVSDEDWATVCQRRSEVARKGVEEKGAGISRQAQYPTRLFDLYCGYCKYPLRLTKAGKYPQVHCPRALDHMDNCPLHSSKSLKIVDECLLGTIEHHFSDDATIEAIVHHANCFLCEEAAKPPVDTVALDKKIRKLNEKLTRMANRVADFDDGPAVDALMANIRACEAERKELTQQRELANRSNFRPESLTLEVVKNLLSDLAGLLRDDVVAAHQILAKAFGRVEVTLGEKRGSRYEWIGKSNLLHAPVLIELARRRKCPSTNTLEFLCGRSWTIDLPTSVDIKFYSNAERLAKSVFEMRSSGTSVAAIAIALGVEPETVESAFKLWEDGIRCCLPLRDYKPRRELPASKVAAITPDVVRMVDEEKMSIAAIAKKLGVSEKLASRAYKQAMGDQLVSMAKAGKPMKIPAPLKLSPVTHKRIRELLLAGGMSYRAIAREVGCDHHAVSEAHKRMKAEVDP